LFAVSFAMSRRRNRLGKFAETALYGIAGGISALAGGRGPRGATPYDSIFRHKKVSLRHYRPGPKRIFRTPVIFVPPFMVRPHVYDLDPGHSFVATLLERGFDVFSMDFGEPGKDDAHLKLDDYVLEFMPRLMRAAMDEAGTEQVVLIGYSMGGIFSYLSAAMFPEKTAAIIPMAAPVDCHKMGLFSAMAQLAGRPGVGLLRVLGNIPGQLASIAFRVATPVKSLSRLASLVPKLWDAEYVRRYAALNAWVNDFADWPEAAFRQFVNEFMGENRLARGRLKLGGQRVNLRDITCPILAFAGKTDRIAPPAACRALLKQVASKDAMCVEVPGGHLGIVVSRSSPRQVWARAAEWLTTRV
jgi:polyhydroxyalkanoate synthase subunit PhaC